MKARDVLQRYGAGERDFRGASLRGLSFKGQCLAGADLSGADIRGTDFTGADLRGVRFCGAKAGLQRRWMVLNLVIALMTSVFSGLLSWLSAASLTGIFSSDSTELILGWTSFLILIVFFFFVICKGVVAGLSAVVGVGAVAVVGAIAVAVSIGGTSLKIFAAIFAGMFAGAIAIAVAVAGAIAVAVPIGAAVAVVGAIAVPVAAIGAIAGAIVVAATVVGAVAQAGAELIAIERATAISILLTSFNIYLAWRAMRDDPRDPFRSTAVAFAAWGGTSFRGADLTDADFTKAELKCCDFRPGKVRQKTVSTRLICTCFQNTTQLALSRPGQTILSDASVRDLLINPERGHNKNFVHANCHGAYLKGANFENANLKGIDLSHADLSGANLKNANLMKANVLDANFTATYLTGACIGSWNVDKQTQFKDVDCQYIYLREQPNDLGNRERRPHDPNKTFAPGDFERLYTQLLHTVEILLKGGMNQAAFAAAFNQIIAENPDITWDSIQSIEKKGPDVLLTLEVPPDTDKAQVEQTFDAAYVARLEAQAEAQALRAQDMKDIALTLAQQNHTITANATNQPAQMDFNAPVSGVAGTVQGAQTLHAPATKPDFLTLLSELQAAIHSGHLSDADKATALAQLKILLESSETHG